MGKQQDLFIFPIFILQIYEFSHKILPEFIE
jgi:hypothetical protein